MKVSKALLGMACIAALVGNACDVQAKASMLVGGLAYHVGEQTYQWEGEEHKMKVFMPMVGVEVDGYAIAALVNSYGKASILTTTSFTYPVTDKVTVLSRVGAMSGYKDTPIGMDVAPFANVEVDYRFDKVHAVVGYIPPIQSGHAGVATLHFKYDF